MVKRVDHEALLRRCQKAEQELERLRTPLRQPVAPPARPPRAPPSLPSPDYSLRFPLDRDHWISVQSNKLLAPKHWNRLARLLDMQRECMCEPVDYVVILPDLLEDAA